MDSMTKLIEDELKQAAYDAGKVARKLGIQVAQVRLHLPVPDRKYAPISEDGWGRMDLRKWAVSRRNVERGMGWEHQDKIELARSKYDQGVVELIQGRDGDYTILYAIPRKVRAVRTPYFRFYDAP